LSSQCPRQNTSFSAAVRYTFIGFADGTGWTIGFNTSFSTAVCYTFIDFADGTGWTIGFSTSFSAAVCYTFIGFALGTGWTIGFNTSTLFTLFNFDTIFLRHLIVYII